MILYLIVTPCVDLKNSYTTDMPQTFCNICYRATCIKIR